MFDMTTYLLTKDNPGGATFIPEEHTPQYLLNQQSNTDFVDGRPLTVSQAIGSLISIILLVGTGVYLAFAG